MFWVEAMSLPEAIAHQPRVVDKALLARWLVDNVLNGYKRCDCDCHKRFKPESMRRDVTSRLGLSDLEDIANTSARLASRWREGALDAGDAIDVLNALAIALRAALPPSDEAHSRSGDHG